MATYKNRNKTFLNDSYHEHGALSWSVVLDSKYNRIDAEARLQDCYGKPIEWDFNCPLRKLHKRIEKLDKIIAEFTAMRNAMLEAEAASKEKKYYY